MKNEHVWRWPIASYLFLGGLGGGLMVIFAAANLVFKKAEVFALGSLAAALIIAIGSGLLVFDLGRPFYFWRVFSKEKTILTVGAWMLGTAIVCNLLYFTSFLSFMPWQYPTLFRLALSWICLLLGSGITIYTGIFLGTIKARPFWNSPMLPVLFFISAISTGMAAQSLLMLIPIFNVSKTEISSYIGLLHYSDVGLIVFEIIILMLYVLIMRFSSTVYTAEIAAKWLNGNNKVQFWIGMVSLGLIFPLIFYFSPEHFASVLASALVLVGGLILRFLVVFTDDRVMLPGEKEFKRWLPQGNEKFLASWEEHPEQVDVLKEGKIGHRL